jgi:CheY-like chemotaxis protein
MKQFILIAEDAFELAELIAEMLAERGYDTAIAPNGQLALDQVSARAPDLLLLDCRMPILDGPEVVRALKADPAHAALPILLMTAMPHEVPAEVASACQGILRKPFAPRELFGAVAGCLGCGARDR